jgi:hypothetical protein
VSQKPDASALEKAKEQGRFEGMIAEKLACIEEAMKSIQVDIGFIRGDTNDRLNINAQDIAKQKGWMAGIGCVAGIIGTFVGTFISGLFSK